MAVRERVRQALPLRRRRQLALLRVDARRPTARIRRLPVALLIGVQRGGTSSLYQALLRHPQFARSLRKEIAYFSEEFDRSEAWYRAHFTVRPWRMSVDATPQYLFHPYAPSRAAALLPSAKLVVLLRDPVERAYSHWRHMTTLHFETLSFEDALQAEDDRTTADKERLRNDPAFHATELLRYSYAARGRYVEQLERWMRYFPREQFLIIPSEALFSDPREMLDRIHRFLGLRPNATPFSNHSRPHSRSQGLTMTPTIERLRLEFARANQGLSSLVDVKPNWIV